MVIAPPPSWLVDHPLPIETEIGLALAAFAMLLFLLLRHPRR
jgi:hypothetical protein